MENIKAQREKGEIQEPKKPLQKADSILLKELVTAAKAPKENIVKLTGAVDSMVEQVSLTRKSISSIYEAQMKILNRMLAELDKGLMKLTGEIDGVTYSRGFYDGRQYFVTTFENIMAEYLGFACREELAKSGKMPAVWVVALAKCLKDTQMVLDISKLAQEEEVKKERDDNLEDSVYTSLAGDKRRKPCGKSIR